MVFFELSIFPVPAWGFSRSSPEISSRRISSSSFTPTYLSRATRSSILSMILMVVDAPTSDAISISSRLSSTSSSTLLLPTTAFVIFSKKPWLDFSRPLSKVSFSSFLKIFLNQLIVHSYLFFITAVASISISTSFLKRRLTSTRLLTGGF